MSHVESKASQAETRAEDLAKKLELKDQEVEQLKDRWREETKNIHQQTREEINGEREKLIKVLVVISLFTLILLQSREFISCKTLS